MTELIYKIVDQNLWDEALGTGTFGGANVDIQDGFIHFSTGTQLAETVSKHFADKTNLWIIAVNPERLGDDLRFEPSRNNELFPHLYNTLKTSEVEWHHAFSCASCDIFEQPKLCSC